LVQIGEIFLKKLDRIVWPLEEYLLEGILEQIHKRTPIWRIQKKVLQ
jgi:hypothetical protein